MLFIFGKLSLDFKKCQQNKPYRRLSVSAIYLEIKLMS